MRLQRAGYFFDPERFEYVAFFNIVEPGELDTAFQAFADFAGVVLCTLERIERVFADNAAIANDSHPSVAFDRAVEDAATGDGTDTADREGPLHQGATELDLALLGPEHAFERFAK